MQLVKMQIGSGVSITSISRHLKELANVQYYRRELTYYDFAAQVKKAEITRRGEAQPTILAALGAQDVTQAPPFGSKEAAGVYAPSKQYLADVWLGTTEQEREYMGLWLAALGGGRSSSWTTPSRWCGACGTPLARSSLRPSSR